MIVPYHSCYKSSFRENLHQSENEGMAKCTGGRGEVEVDRPHRVKATLALLTMMVCEIPRSALVSGFSANFAEQASLLEFTIATGQQYCCAPCSLL